MAFVKKDWKDRIAEFINRRRLTYEDGRTELVEVARDEGTVSQEGDAFTAETMNDLEERIAEGFKGVEEGITTHIPPVVIFATVEDVDNWLNTISDNLPDGTHYTRRFTCNTNHPAFGGGVFLLDGFKASNDYQCQKVTSYSIDNDGLNRHYERTKYASVWGEWYKSQKDADADFNPNSKNPIQNKVVTNEIYRIQNSYAREITVDIGDNSVTADLLNQYLSPLEHNLGGFVIANLNGGYLNATTMLINTVANRGGQGQYGHAISISFYTGIRSWQINGGVWQEYKSII